eukprot:1045209-Prymnesium_polylepis.1
MCRRSERRRQVERRGQRRAVGGERVAGVRRRGGGSALPERVDARQIASQQRMLPRRPRGLAEEEGHLVVFVEVPLPARRQRLGQRLTGDIEQPGFGLRVDTEVARVAQQDLSSKHGRGKTQAGLRSTPAWVGGWAAWAARVRQHVPRRLALPSVRAR